MRKESSRRSSRLLNIGGVLIGFLIGQGSLFALSSLLLFQGRPEFVGDLGLALGTLSLGLWIVDLGGVYYLPQAYVEARIGAAIPAAILGRLVFVVPLALAAILALALWPDAGFATRAILWGAVLVAPVWSLNVAGALDATGHAGFAGVVGNLSTFSAVVYAFAAYGTINITPFFLAAAFSLGAALTIGAQYWILRRKAPEVLDLVRPQLEEVKDFFRFGLGYVLSQIPAQAYARLVIMLVAIALGSSAAGYYVYVKTIINAFAQASVAIRRVDYKGLVIRVRSTTPEFREVIGEGRLVRLLALGPLLGSLALLGVGIENSHYQPVVQLLPYFSVVFAVWVFAANGGNVVIALGGMREFVAWNFVAILVGLLLVWALLPILGVRGVALAELTMHLTQLTLFCRIYNSSTVERRCESVC